MHVKKNPIVLYNIGQVNTCFRKELHDVKFLFQVLQVIIFYPGKLNIYVQSNIYKII